jgi:hypothetical protein
MYLEKRRNISGHGGDLSDSVQPNNDGYASGLPETVRRTTGARTRQAAEPLNLVHKVRKDKGEKKQFQCESGRAIE